MSIWQNCTMTTLYHSADESDDWPCIVKIEDNKILVEYDYEGITQYKGEAHGEGHYLLTSDDVFGKASLHIFPEASLLVGNWNEGGNRGMWQIKLA